MRLCGAGFRGYKAEELLLKRGGNFQVAGIDVVDGIYEIRMIQLKY